MKNFTLSLFLVCCFTGLDAQLLTCSATIGFRPTPNAMTGELWADNFVGDSANTTFSWLFCDGTTDSGLYIVHPMYSGGALLTNCNVCLTLTDNTAGCSFTVCDTVNTNGNPSNNCAAYATFTHVDSLYTFFASTTGGNPVVYEWSVNGTLFDTTASITLVVDSGNALNGGTLVCVNITDANGCISSDCVILTNSGNPNGGGVPCQAYFVIYPDTGANVLGQPGYYVGVNLSSGNYGSNVLWDFGDGTTSTDPYPIHNYPVPGNYIVCLTVGVPGTNCYDTYCDSSFYVFKTDGGLMSHLSFASPTGISDVTENTTLHLFPNPVKNELNWLPENKVEQVKIFDLSGKKMVDAKITGNKINLSKLSAGTYFIQISGKDGKQLGVRRFVKE